jgi:molecular chaperone HtpG
MTSSTSETFAFQAEINQLMSLIINTFYSNKDIFLRELISNASDAIDKEKYNSLSNNEGTREYYIKLVADKEAKTLTIEDNGIGLKKDEMIKCLGTIANSGTKQFMENLKDSSSSTDTSMIGQFGVGFYSAYLVANNVKVYSNTLCWESKAGGSFSIEEFDEVKVEHGVKIVLEMKDECLEYLEESKITEIVKVHSEFINYPIKLWTSREESKEVVEEEEVVEKLEEGKIEEGKIEEVVDKEVVQKMKTVTEVIEEWKHINTMKPLWMRKPDEVTDEEHTVFYKGLTKDWDTYIKVKHFSAEGQIEFKSVLYIPRRAPYDMFQNNKKKNNIKLYVKRVFVMDKCDDLIPDWLSFVSGIVDCEDLPLNVSREMLQQNKIMNVMKKNLVKKCIESFNEMADDEDQTIFDTFYDNFHQSLKIGIHEDTVNRPKLVKLLRYNSVNHKDKKISFQKYVDEMIEGQENIYYITGESMKAVENSPLVKGVREKGYDVMFMVDPIDEYMTQQVRDYGDKKFVNITKDNTFFQEKNEEFEEYLCKRIKSVLEVEKVVLSNRLGESPCCLVTGEYGWSANMERIMKAQTLQSNNTNMSSSSKKIMEINPNNAMIKKLQNGIKNTSMADSIIKDVIKLMYDTALVSSGFTHEDPSVFSDRIYRMIGLGIDVQLDEEEDKEEEIIEDISKDIDVVKEECLMEELD